MAEEEARAAFQAIRWADTAGKPYCPRCGCTDSYTIATRHLWKCKGCTYQYSVTSGTIFASRKLAIRDILLAIAIFVNGAKGHSALQLSRDLDVQYKTAFVLLHKIRKSLAAENDEYVSGEVEIDGCYVGGYVKPANHKDNRRDRRLARNQNGKRRVVIVMRERGGNVKTFVTQTEDASLPALRARIMEGSIVYADEASHWDQLHAKYDTRRINHSKSYSSEDACTNLAESFFSRLRRCERGIHHHISGTHLGAYAAEMAWRENNSRISNGRQYWMTVNAVARQAKSDQWCGYWQRRKAA